MQVVEKFISINGEGTRAGELAVFIRFRGCNLRCSYCDTMWANEAQCPFEEMTPEEIAAYIRKTGVTNVTLTGGEPLLQKEMPQLLELLSKEETLRVEIETNGAVDLAPFCGSRRRSEEAGQITAKSVSTSEEAEQIESKGVSAATEQSTEKRNRLVFTMDYKLPSSTCEAQMKLTNFQYLSSHDTVKFVIGSKNDLQRAEYIVDKYDLIHKCHVYFSPVFGAIEPEEIVEYMMSHHLNGVRLQIQLHKVIWDPMKRGV